MVNIIEDLYALLENIKQPPRRGAAPRPQGGQADRQGAARPRRRAGALALSSSFGPLVPVAQQHRLVLRRALPSREVGSGCCLLQPHPGVGDRSARAGTATIPAASARPGSAAITFSGRPRSTAERSGRSRPARRSHSGSTQVSRVPAGRPRTVASSRSPKPNGGGGEAVLNGPACASREPDANSPWSRASITCIGASYGPGASTSPPAAIRRTHQVKRPVWSCGPTT